MNARILIDKVVESSLTEVSTGFVNAVRNLAGMYDGYVVLAKTDSVVVKFSSPYEVTYFTKEVEYRWEPVDRTSVRVYEN